MTETRLKELQTEIARLKEIDNKHTEAVAAEFEAIESEKIEVPCSAELDNEWYNESI